jgi:hypothetical protein
MSINPVFPLKKDQIAEDAASIIVEKKISDRLYRIVRDNNTHTPAFHRV